jgi:hypothetical protein
MSDHRTISQGLCPGPCDSHDLYQPHPVAAKEGTTTADEMLREMIYAADDVLNDEMAMPEPAVRLAKATQALCRALETGTPGQPLPRLWAS